MSEQYKNFAHLSSALEAQLIEQEIRSEAQLAAARAIGRAVRRFFAYINSVLIDATEMQLRARSNDTHSV